MVLFSCSFRGEMLPANEIITRPTIAAGLSDHLLFCFKWPRLSLALALIVLVSCEQSKPSSESGESSIDISTMGPTVEPTTSSTAQDSDTQIDSCPDELWTPVESEEDIADSCVKFTDQTSCMAAKIEAEDTHCRWTQARRFAECGNFACESSTWQGLCIAISAAPETGCGPPCDGHWRRTASELFVIQEAYCFEVPRGWRMCDLLPRAECMCPCPEK